MRSKSELLCRTSNRETMLYLAIAVGLLAAVSPISASGLSITLRNEVKELSNLISSIETRLNATAQAKLDDKTSTIYTCWKLQLSDFKAEAAKVYAPIASLSLQASNLINQIDRLDDATIEKLVDKLYAEDGGLLQQGYDLIGNYSRLAAGVHREVLNLNSASCN